MTKTTEHYTPNRHYGAFRVSPAAEGRFRIVLDATVVGEYLSADRAVSVAHWLNTYAPRRVDMRWLEEAEFHAA